MTDKIPEGYHTITPTIMVEGAKNAIELYKKAFGATLDYCMENEGKVMHACLTIGNSKLFLGDASPEMGCGGPSVASFYLYVEDVDAAFKKAQQAGLTESWPVQDMFWGDRTGTLKDPYGLQWTVATHVKDLSDAEIEKGKQEFMAKMKNQPKAA